MPFYILLILGALSAFGPLAIDMYLPAFPAIGEALNADAEQVQWSLSVYFLGLASGQLVYGPLADRFGRRLPLLFGVALFCVASFACAMAPTLEWLLAARFAQALGGCAGMVVTRAVVRDLCAPIDAAKAFSQLMLIMGVAPILAPLAGGAMLKVAGWPSIFWFLTLFSALFALAVYFFLPETLPEDTPPARLGSALGRYLGLLREPVFMFHSLTGGVAMAGMFAYIAGSPYIFIEMYGLSVDHYAWLFGANAAGFILFAQLNSRLLRHNTPLSLLKGTTGVYCAATVTLLVVALLHSPNIWLFLPPLFCSVAVISLVIPNASACALAGHGHQAGVASALMGTMQFAIAGLTSALVGVLHDGSSVPMALVMAGCGVVTVTMAFLARRASARAPQPNWASR
ncbi:MULTISPECIES: multidrug effflux MFS transporter [Pseudomonas]|uniref:Bcr/CflA family efflux transporter n=1 Tax=Pseudomonas neustonica TaxID=2487346 RepID=A0ABX9XE16_9PSED|nr:MULTISPECIES: multidrug effflux MFS transporter [Pseudomonas]MAB25930.1 Bcr/CflA family drug resistance efflux transporter [Pseudomonadales bacterium]MBA6421331.1 multidrug effflux MFS transporter [Pseudomonas sp. 5Ae-yellow]ROZ80484.1 Bcr/CflA family efflux MFS transporter [Pseudomonas sp. SSM44]ROZ81691.1 Bcr/CflA family efflux MFS transporter [Pseudomonas neustonica]|tara:strand:+ start:281 stop:1480 length:1200 start_codon:yes stop_codon:yes gene_type:complete